MIDMYRKKDYISEEFTKYDNLTAHPVPATQEETPEP